MTDSRVALDADRLPWLTAEPKPAVTTGWSLLASWAAVLLLVVAGGAYWLGRTSEVQVARDTPAPRASITLPAPTVERQVAPATPKVDLPPPPPVAQTAPQPVAAPERASKAKPRPSATTSKRTRSAKRVASKPRKAAVSRSDVQRKSPVTRRAKPIRSHRFTARRPSWPAPPTALYLGRMVQLGTYPSRDRLDRAWAYRVQRYPQLRGLPKVVVPYRTSTGATRYRLQAMTAAPAQASWLCRRLRADWRSCAVLRPRTANG